MQIIDVITYNGEADLLEIRLNILDRYVDQFIIVEAPTTFSGNPKPLYFDRDIKRFLKWMPKIKYFVIDENYSDEEIRQAEESPNTQGASHWKREFLQKESIKKALIHLKDYDVCYIGDCDEVWDINHPNYSLEEVWKFKLKVNTYYLNNRSSEVFYGNIYGKYKNIKDKCLNHLRTNARETDDYCGWHFTSLKDGLRRKLTDSYTTENYATDAVLDNLEDNVENSRDFLGRNFTYEISEIDLPQYLLDNKNTWKHLFK